ncbi:hypothetical protein WDW89_24425 [Deltaproteobacteria bacterium TL4]
MSESQEAIKRQEQMMRQFKRIDSFLQANSKKFYQEFDTYNTQLVNARLKLLDQSKGDTVSEEMKEVLEIDDEDGIASRLNITTLSLARLANPQLFNFLIKKKLDPNGTNYLQIPLEVDAILFITNPMLVFDLIHDFLKFRARYSSYIYMYISNRISRWLFRFTQFVMIYDKFDKIVQLTLLQPKRFNPFKQQFQSAIQLICAEALDCIIDGEKPLFINDLRRLYLIMSKALLISTSEGEIAAPEICAVLKELIPIIDIDPSQLKADRIEQEFEQFHFLNPKEQFAEQYQYLKQQDFSQLSLFLGHLHPEDRMKVLKQDYLQSQTDVLRIFSEIKTYYQSHDYDLPDHYQTIVETLRMIVDYQSVIQSTFKNEKLIQHVFVKGTLSLEEFPEFVEELDIHKSYDNIIPKETIFNTFHFNSKQALEQNYLFELSGLPYCFLTIEYARPHFQYFTLGELLLLDLPNRAYRDFLGYLLGSGQMVPIELEVCLNQLPEMTDLVSGLADKIKLRRKKISVYDRNNMLRFYDFKKAIQELHDLLEIRYPSLLTRFQYTQFLSSILGDIQRWVARKKDISLQELKPEWVSDLIYSPQIQKVYDQLQSTLTGHLYGKYFDFFMEQKVQLGKQLIEMHQSQQSILNYERVRFQQTAEVLPEKATAPLPPPQTPEVGANQGVSVFYQAGKKAFQVMSESPANADPWLIEWGRYPFRYVDFSGGVPVFTLFTMSDCIAMEMKRKTLFMVMEYALKTQQLTVFEYEVMKKNIVSLTYILKQATQNVKWSQERPVWSASEESLNFQSFGQLLSVTDPAIHKQLPRLADVKANVRVYQEGLSELQHWFEDPPLEPYTHAYTKNVFTIFAAPEKLNQLVTALKQTPYGKRNVPVLTRNTSNLRTFGKHLKYEYQLNARLLKYLQA